MELIRFKDYSFKYALGKKDALSNINLEIKEGAFVVIFGCSGSGKSTILRCIKKEIVPAGSVKGEIITKLNDEDIAIVFQDPDTQLVCNSVIEDLVFYMENLGFKQQEMQKRLAETVHYFGLESLLSKNTNELSGGQKQLLVLCAALMTRPKLLLLDEPVSQLDPIAVKEFLNILARVNEDFKVTIIMSEHRLDESITVADELVFMKDGQIIKHDETRNVLKEMLIDNNNDLFIPSIPRLTYKLGINKICISPKEFKDSMDVLDVKSPSQSKSSLNKVDIKNENIIYLNRVFFTYDKQLDFIIKDLSFKVMEGERICLLGGNGSGKSTLLKLIAKIIKPSFGTIKGNTKKISYMPQNLKQFFRFNTVKEEVFFNNEVDDEMLKLFDLEGYYERHPYDLSGGESAKLALYCSLQKEPDLILLDEPTKGLDPYSKNIICDTLINQSKTVICATHDLEFAAKFATKCVMLFNGSITFADNPKDFFKANQYYTTPIHMATRNFISDLIIIEDLKDYE